MFSDQTLDQLRQQTDLVALVRESVPSLKKAGRHWKALCPFHQEKTPSFVVSPEKGIFHCFGCGKGGDAIRFVMWQERLEFPEAVQALAKRCGLVLEESQRRQQPHQTRERQALYEVLEFAAGFYEKVLWTQALAGGAMAYLKHRDLKEETLKRFRIGFAPSQGRSLLQEAPKQGFSVEQLVKAGLVSFSEKTRKHHDHFWNRVIFPILDAKGQVIAFGGRVLDESLPKYINSPETAVYSKSHHLYGLYQAGPTLRQSQTACVMEGYMDVVSAHQHGVTQAVAPLGTALTPEQARLLKRYVERVVISYDGDTAGQEASWRGAQIVMEQGFFVRVAQIPEGLDPDGFLRKYGREKFLNLLETSPDLLEFQLALQRQRQKSGTLSLEERLALAGHCLEMIRRCPDELQRSEWIKLLAGRLSLDAGVLAKQAAGRKESRRLSQETAPRAPMVRSLEEEILQVVLRHPELRTILSQASFDFEEPRCARVWKLLQSAKDSSDFSKISGSLDEPDSQWFSGLVLEQKEWEKPLEVLENLLDSAHRRKQMSRHQELAFLVPQMLEGRLAQDTRKIQEFQELTRILKGSQH